MNAQSAISRAIAEKRRLMFERHGGIMSSTDVAREVGYEEPQPSVTTVVLEEHTC